MLLPTMKYEEMYREICNDSRDLFAAITGKLAEFRQFAKRAKQTPYGRIYHWKHPVSYNQYTYFFFIRRHSDWDKTPRLLTYTEFDTKDGKITIAVVREPNENIRIRIFRPHFFDRYDERNLSKYTRLDALTEHDIKILFLLRTSSTISLGDKVASLREQEKHDPDLIDDGLLTTEGLIETKIVRKNPNIVLFRTFLSIQDLFEEQYKEVTMQALNVFYLRASNDSPRFQKSIEKVYLEGVAELNRLWLDPDLPFEEKQALRKKKYGEVIDELTKYII